MAKIITGSSPDDLQPPVGPKRRGRPPRAATVEEITRRTYTENEGDAGGDSEVSDFQGRVNSFQDLRYVAKTYRVDDKGRYSFVFACEPSEWSEDACREKCPQGDFFAVQVIDRQKQGKGNIAFNSKCRVDPAPVIDEGIRMNTPVEVMPDRSENTTIHDFLMLTIKQMQLSHDERMKSVADREKSFTSMVTQIMPLMTGREKGGSDLENLSKYATILKDLKSGDDVGSLLKRLQEMDELKSVIGSNGPEDFSWGSVLKGLAAHVMPLVIPLLSKLAANVPNPQPMTPAPLQLSPHPSPVALPSAPVPVTSPPVPVPSLVKPNGEDKASKDFEGYLPVLVHALNSEDVDYAYDWVATLLESMGDTPPGQSLIRYLFVENTFETLSAKYPKTQREDFKQLYERLYAELFATPESDSPPHLEPSPVTRGTSGSGADDPGDEKSGA